MSIASDIQPRAHQSRYVVVFGDSITEGADLPSDQRENIWLKLVEQYSEGRLRMVNEGKGGRPTHALEEFGEMLGRHQSLDLLVLALGGNDARDISGNCVPLALANLRTMVSQSRDLYGETTSILLVGPTNIRKDALGPTRNIAEEREANLQALNAAYRELAAELGCHFVSLFGAVPLDTLTMDGVHPDSEGHAAIASVMLPALLAALGWQVKI